MSRQLSAAWVAALALTLLTVPRGPAGAEPMVELAEGDLIVLDLSDDAVIHVDGVSGVKTVLTSGPGTPNPRGVTFSPEGLLFLTDAQGDVVLRLDPWSGQLVGVTPVSGAPLAEPAAIVSDPTNGDVLFLDGNTGIVTRIDPATAAATTEFVTTLDFPLGMAISSDQKLLVADTASGAKRGIYRVEPETGSETALAVGGNFVNLWSLAVEASGDIVAADPTRGSLFRIKDLPAGDPSQSVEELPGFDGVYSVAVDPTTGDLVVADFFAGQIDSVDPVDGARSFLVGGFAGPFGVAVVPALSPRDHDQFLISDADADTSDGSGAVFRADSAADTRTALPGLDLADQIEPVALALADPAGDLTSGFLYVIDGPSTILRHDLAAGTNTALSTGGLLSDLTDLAVEWDGQIIAVDRNGSVVRVDATTGAQSLLASWSGEPLAVVIDANGSIFVSGVGTGESFGLVRVNPLTGELTEFTVFQVSGGTSQAKAFEDPALLAIDPNGNLIVVERGGDTADPEIFRVLGTNGPVTSVFAFGIADASVSPTLPDAAGLAIDGNRDILLAYAVDEPVRIDELTGLATTLTVDGPFATATDLLVEGIALPGEPTDADGDDVPDGIDTCPDLANPDQTDSNGDGQGDVCQLFDFDLDGFPDDQDNCPAFPNPDQSDRDGDGVGDACDNCLVVVNPNQSDVNADDIGDLCQDELGGPDSDGDGIPDDGDSSGSATDNPCGHLQTEACDDNCTSVFNPDQSDLNEDLEGDGCQTGDSDFDGIPDEGGAAPCQHLQTVACDDNCPNVFNAAQSDLSGDGVGDVCQDALAGPDTDDDGIPDDGGPAPCAHLQTVGCDDNCRTVFNPNQSDLSGDGRGDVCQHSVQNPDTDRDGIPDDGGPAPCAHLQTVGCDDNCRNTFNPTQSDLSGDGVGDICQTGDSDGDGIPDDGNGGGDPSDSPCPSLTTVSCDDNCTDVANATQQDLDGDGFGDVCQHAGTNDDPDRDGVRNADDNCPNAFNPPTEDLDGDLDVDVDDQPDIDGDGVGDACQADDPDGDGWSSGGPSADNCPFYPNPDQTDTNGDGIGDACQVGDIDRDGFPDGDSDGDGWIDPLDNCPGTPNPDQADANDDLIGDLCQPDDPDGDGWPNSGINLDNCPGVPNPDQSDLSGDGIGDVCQPDDPDGDGIPDDGTPGGGAPGDNPCTSLTTAGCDDNCPDVPNPDQSDADPANGVGDACEGTDSDGDGASDAFDNCPSTPNAYLQGTCFLGDVGALCLTDADCDVTPGDGDCSLNLDDFDGDGEGDVCDATPLPEPSEWLMLLSGVGMLRLLKSRRGRD